MKEERRKSGPEDKQARGAGRQGVCESDSEERQKSDRLPEDKHEEQAVKESAKVKEERQNKQVELLFLPTVACLSFVAGFGLAFALSGPQVEGEGHDSQKEPAQAASDLLAPPQNRTLDEIFIVPFFNLSCIAANGTGDPRDAEVARSYSGEMFGGLRIEYLVFTFFSVLSLFSLAQLGGIPRPALITPVKDNDLSVTPEPEDQEAAAGTAAPCYIPNAKAAPEVEAPAVTTGTPPNAWETLKQDPVGTLFWFVWMLTQFLQWLVILCSLAMHVASFVSMRHRLWNCLVVDADGNVRLDEFAAQTCAQPHTPPPYILYQACPVSAGVQISPSTLAACGSSAHETPSRVEQGHEPAGSALQGGDALHVRLPLLARPASVV